MRITELSNGSAGGDGFDTLETRNRDHLDFHNVAGWEIKEAIERAYQLGRASR